MSKVPLRIFGFCLLAVTLSLTGCQSVWHSVTGTVTPPALERAVN